MFTPDTPAFLAENHGRNDRDWFLAHKEDYERFVRRPLIDLADQLAPTVQKIDGQLITDPRLSVSRIYCDARYSRGMLYRDCMWISFRRDRRAFPCWPEFFFVISPKEFFYGCGYYTARADAMTAIRKLILADAPAFRRAKEAFDAQDAFSITGNRYKRPPFPDAPAALREWLDCRSICFTRTPAHYSELYAPDFADTVDRHFTALEPMYTFLLAGELEAAKLS